MGLLGIAKKAGKKIYHGTSDLFDDFDVSKSADGSIWFTDNKSKILSGDVGASTNGNVMERIIDEDKLKLATWDDTDKYSTGQLIDQGFDGVKMVEDGENTYQIFNPEKLSKVESLNGPQGLLDMDTPSRMARAKDQGFNKDSFHYSRNGEDIKEIREGNLNLSLFDALGIHTGSKEAAAKRATSTRSIDPNTGKLIEPIGPTYPFKIKHQKPLLNKDGNPYTESELHSVFAKMAEDKDYGDVWDIDVKDKLRSDLWDDYDVIPYINEVEDAGNVSYISPPSAVRSKYAAFDPAKESSRNLLASNPVATTAAGLLGAGAMMGSDDADAGILGKATGLLMDTPSRMARATEQGFTGDDAYRGIYGAYNPEKSGNYQMFTSSPQDAGEYGDNVLKAKLKRGNNLEVNGAGRNFNSIYIGDLPKDVYNNLHAANRESSIARTDDIAYAAQAAGYDSVTIKDVYDKANNEIPSQKQEAVTNNDFDILAELGIDANHPLLNGPSQASAPAVDIPKDYGTSNIDIIFDPKNIRSTNARFDPAKSNSSNILASKPAATMGAGILGAIAAAQSNDTYADYSPSNLARLQNDDVGSYQAAQSPQLARAAGLMGQVNKRGVDDPLMGFVAPRIPSELMDKIAYNDRRGITDYLKASAGLIGLY